MGNCSGFCKQHHERLFATLGLLLIIALQAAYGLSNSKTSTISFDALVGKKILVVGGSGRVGGSVVTQLVQRGCRQVTVGGTNEQNYEKSLSRWQQLFPTLDFQQLSFRKVDRERAETLATTTYDLIIHTAGPFQGKVVAPNGILQACVDASIPYIDVCDDYCTASAAKTKYAAAARAPCILSTGTWPGVSSLLAKQLVAKALKKHPDLTPADLKLEFGFFTAGSGGAGVTLLVATFLILAEQALTVVNGRRVPVRPLQDYERVDFGATIGPKDIAPMNLLETASIHDCLGVGSTSARFGTAPWYWNALLGSFAAVVPKSLLENEPVMRQLSTFSMPIVRFVDAFAGATNAIRVDLSVQPRQQQERRVTDESTKKQPPQEPEHLATVIYGHENLEPCVGECIVAFAAAILSGSVAAGVWFPEEAIPSGEDAAAVLGLASVGAHTTTVEGLDLTREDVYGKQP